jgi:hypothetical protein
MKIDFLSETLVMNYFFIRVISTFRTSLMLAPKKGRLDQNNNQKAIENNEIPSFRPED